MKNLWIFLPLNSTHTPQFHPCSFVCHKSKPTVEPFLTEYYRPHTINENRFPKRMHSSRMRTGRSLTVCRSLLLDGGVLSPGGCLLWGVSAPGGSAPGGSASDMPPVNRITDTSKNITLATTSLRPVKIILNAQIIHRM